MTCCACVCVFCECLCVRLCQRTLSEFDEQIFEPLTGVFLNTVFSRYLFTGNEFQSLAENFRMGYTTVRKIVLDVCKEINKVLAPIYMARCTEQHWLQHAEKFDKIWNFPNCVGAVDGKHVQLCCPPKSGTTFFNYKGYYSLVLLAVASADYRFIMVDVGGYGSSSDKTILKESTFGRKLFAGDLNLPPPRPIAGFHDQTPMPFVIVADAAFGSRPSIMRPYPGRPGNLSEDKRIYNYRHKRARIVSEDTFGILAARFRIFHRRLFLTPDVAQVVILAACNLHNFLVKPRHTAMVQRDQRGNAVQPAGLQAIYSMSGNRAATQSLVFRAKFKNYFISQQGQVPWQRASAHLDMDIDECEYVAHAEAQETVKHQHET